MAGVRAYNDGRVGSDKLNIEPSYNAGRVGEPGPVGVDSYNRGTIGQKKLGIPEPYNKGKIGDSNPNWGQPYSSGGFYWGFDDFGSKPVALHTEFAGGEEGNGRAYGTQDLVFYLQRADGEGDDGGPE